MAPMSLMGFGIAATVGNAFLARASLMRGDVPRYRVLSVCSPYAK